MSTSQAVIAVAVPSGPQSAERSGAEQGEPRLQAQDVMSPPVTSVRATTPITLAAAVLACRGFAGVPVVDGADQVIGLVTEADLVRNQLRRAHRRPTPTCMHPVAEAVGEVMTSTPLLAPRDHDLAELVALMLAAGTNTVPIVDGGRLVGVVDMRDVLRVVGSQHGGDVPTTSIPLQPHR